LEFADTPGALLEANLQADLSPTNRLADTSWIDSGKASWNWWSDNVSRTGKSGDDAFTTDVMKEYVRRERTAILHARRRLVERI
jgi:alpha-glucosidase